MIKILHVEDSEMDAELIRAQLDADHLECEFTRVQHEDDFVRELEHGQYDLIMSDFRLPGFSGADVLRLASEKRPDWPFIFASGTIGDDRAVETLKQGAIDYVIKDRLARLGAAVRRALGEAAARRKREADETALREQADLLNKASDVILVCNLAGEIQDRNHGAERVLGWPAAATVGQMAAAVLFKEVPPEFAVAEAAVLEKGEWTGELLLNHRDGTRVPVDSRWTLVRTAEGKPKAKLLINTDLTEKRKLEEQFLRAQRLESIGLLASGIAHDLNNVLAPFMMIVPLLRERLNDASYVRLLDSLESSAERGSGLVRQILSFARGAEAQRVLVQTRHIIRDLDKMVHETFPRSIEFHRDIAKDLWVIKANPTHIHQVLLNLLVNARDAMPDGGRLTIAASNCVLDESQAQLIPGGRPGSFLRVDVADTGTGIPPEVLPRIFDPFFTTKPAGQGTGLGLSTVLGIIKSHRGFLDIQTQAGRGTTFCVYLPTENGAAEVGEVGGDQRALRRGQGEMILVVDDDASVREVLENILTDAGYWVIMAANGAEGMSEFLVHRQEIRLLVADLIMPVMSGAVLIKAVRHLDQDLPILAITGMEGEAQQTEEIKRNTQGFLWKPFASRDLLRAVQTALDEVRETS